MKQKIVWNDTYRDVRFEINNFQIDGLGSLKDCWTFYLYLPLEQLPKDIRKRFWLRPSLLLLMPLDTPRWKRFLLKAKAWMTYSRKLYKYYDEPLIADLEWHGGCTWYEKYGIDFTPRAVQIGCDYQHFYDEGHRYILSGVERDAKACIDSLHAVINIKRWCSYCGKYFDPVKDEIHCLDCVDK